MNYQSMIAKNFSRAAKTYDKAAVLQQEIGNRLINRLNFIKISPETILDLGSGTGFFSEAILKKYPTAKLFNLDIAEGMLLQAKQKNSNFDFNSYQNPYFICGNGEFLPFSKNSIDFIFSNCVLQWAFNPQKILTEIHRVLKKDGLFLFSTLGPDTLTELQQSFSTFDPYIHVNSFTDMHHLGDQLLNTNFADPVMDMEYITLTYQTVSHLIQDLRQTGSNIVYSSFKGLRHKNFQVELTHHYEKFRRSDNRLPATFEVIYGHAFGTNIQNLYRADDEGVIYIPADELEEL